MNILFAFFAVFCIIFIVPIVVYGLFSKFFGIVEPDKKTMFFVSVVVQKIGTAVGFVWLYTLMGGVNWMLYALIWFVMFAIVEIGQSIVPNYSKKEAVAGIISEAIYFPLAALSTFIIL